MMFLFEQLLAGSIILLGWWIIHQTAHDSFVWSVFFMQAGIGVFTIMLAVETLLHVSGSQFLFNALLKDFFIGILFLGIAIFHRTRFSKL